MSRIDSICSSHACLICIMMGAKHHPSIQGFIFLNQEESECTDYTERKHNVVFLHLMNELVLYTQYTQHGLSSTVQNRHCHHHQQHKQKTRISKQRSENVNQENPISLDCMQTDIDVCQHGITNLTYGNIFLPNEISFSKS